MPIIFKIILNILLYIFYTLFFWTLFGIIFPIILLFLGKNVLNPNDPIFNKIGIILALIVLIVSIIFRKYFYISFDKKVKKIKNNEFFDNSLQEDLELNELKSKVNEIYKNDNDKNSNNLEIIIGNKKN